MSNHRSEVENKEKLIAEYLSDPNAPIRRSSRISGVIANEISDEFDGTIENASHIGNSYDSIGDLELILDGEPIYTELKILNGGYDSFGTLANITPKGPIKSGMFSGNPMYWEEFNEEQDHMEEVLSQLKKFPNYPKCVENKCSTDKQTKKYKGRYIRDLIVGKTKYDFDPEVAENINDSYSLGELKDIANQIKSNIEEFDRKVKIKYIEYLSNFDVDSSKLKAYTIILVAGYHKEDQMLNYLDVVDEVVDKHSFSNVGDVFENYEVFYARKKDDGVEVDRSYRSDVIDKLCEIPAEDYEFRFGGSGEDVSNTGFSIGINGGNEFEQLISMALHWGNKFQGIESRRLNCFKSKKLSEMGNN